MRQRHVDDNAVALLHAQRLQAIGEAADIAIQLAIGDDALGAVFAQPDEGGAVGVLRVGVAIERVNGDVGARAGKPLVMDPVPLENLVPWLGPDELLGSFGPESVRIALKAVPLGWPVFQQRLLFDDLRSGILFHSLGWLRRFSLRFP